MVMSIKPLAANAHLSLRRIAGQVNAEKDLIGCIRCQSIYLLAGGSMFNLIAGWGDSLNAFDITLAVMTAGINYMVTEGSQHPPGVHLLPSSAWEPVLTHPENP